MTEVQERLSAAFVDLDLTRRRLPAPPLPDAAVAVVRVACAAAVVAGWCLFYLLGLSGLSGARSQQLLYDQLRHRLAVGEAPLGGAIAPGTPVALIEAPAIHMRYVVVEGTSAGDLANGPGHRRDTPLPGQAGTSVIYGRGVGYGGPFAAIAVLKPGDTITVTTGQGVFDYRVDALRRGRDPLPDTLRSGQGRLTLATAEGTNWRSGWAPDHIVYVDASLQGPPQPAPAGRPTVLPATERAMASDPSAWIEIVLWLQLLVMASGAAAWTHVRWGGAQTWLVFAPLILAVLWGLAGSAGKLLPNLY